MKTLQRTGGLAALYLALAYLVALFGLSQMVWYAGVGIALLRSNPGRATAPTRASSI